MAPRRAQRLAPHLVRLLETRFIVDDADVAAVNFIELLRESGDRFDQIADSL